MLYVNPLCARLETTRHVTGLWSATVDCDHGLANRTRVHHSFGWLSEHDARIAGKRLAFRLGRAVIAATVAAVMILPGMQTRASEAPRAPLAILDIDGAQWRCTSQADCADMLRRLGCSVTLQSGDSALLDCDESEYRRALARHSA